MLKNLTAENLQNFTENISDSDEQTHNNLFENNVYSQGQQDLNDQDEHGKSLKITDTQEYRKRKNKFFDDSDIEKYNAVAQKK